MVDAVRACLAVLTIAWRTNRMAFVLAVGEVLANVLRFIQPLVVAWVVHSLVQGDAHGVLAGVAVWALALGAGAALEIVAVSSRVRLIFEVGHAFDMELMGTISAASNLNVLEHPDTAAAIDRVRDRADAMGYTYNQLMTVVIQLAAPITSLIVAMVIDWRLVLLLLAGVPSLLLSKKSAEINDRAEQAASTASARLHGWLVVLQDPSCRAERQVFRTWPWMRARASDALADRDRSLVAGATSDGRLGLFGEISYLVGAGLVVWWVVAANSGLPAGILVATILVALDMRGTLGAVRFAVGGLGPGIRAAVTLRGLREAITSLQTAGDSSAPGVGEMEFDNAGYEYSDGSTGLRDLTLRLDPGQLVAVVGANGAGKSTFAEMVLGLRDATTGAVVRSGDRATTVMQSFARPELLLGESIALRDIGSDIVQHRVWEALERATNSGFWRQLPDGLQTQLGSDHRAGRDLSGGQWQTVAAARAQFKDEVDVIVLDEPTSALDPEAQDALTARYLKAARRVTEAGGLAVFITHRMSMPRLADRILVFEDGRLAEDGDHEQLMEARGLYFESYTAAVDGYLQLGAWDSGSDVVHRREVEREPATPGISESADDSRAGEGQLGNSTASA